MDVGGRGATSCISKIIFSTLKLILALACQGGETDGSRKRFALSLVIASIMGGKKIWREFSGT